MCPTPVALPLAYHHRTTGLVYVCGYMCVEIVVYASACVLRNKMTCTMKLDYSEEEVRNVNLTHSSSPKCAKRQDTGQDVCSWVWMQWMTVTYLVPCHVLHVAQHVHVSLSNR